MTRNHSQRTDAGRKEHFSPCSAGVSGSKLSSRTRSLELCSVEQNLQLLHEACLGDFSKARLAGRNKSSWFSLMGRTPCRMALPKGGTEEGSDRSLEGKFTMNALRFSMPLSRPPWSALTCASASAGTISDGGGTNDYWTTARTGMGLNRSRSLRPTTARPIFRAADHQRARADAVGQCPYSIKSLKSITATDDL